MNVRQEDHSKVCSCQEHIEKNAEKEVRNGNQGQKECQETEAGQSQEETTSIGEC
jgi:hypothetical protein